MEKIIENTIKKRPPILLKSSLGYDRPYRAPVAIVSSNAKAIAWAIFIMLFVENDTFGLFPPQFYMIFRNVRLSDLILYGLIIYSLSNIREYQELFQSKLLIIIKLLLIYMVFQFIVSVISYGQNPIEYFFRLKALWFSLMIFPFLLLLKRGGFNYLIKLILPVAIISNILYILTATTGISFLHGTSIVTQSLPGGLKVFRVYGGTFYGEYFFLGFIFKWITEKFRLYQLPLVILFVLPHILAFGRSTWALLTFSVFCMYLWNFLRKKDFKIIFKQGIVIIIFGLTLIYSFIKIIPESSYMTEAVGARIEQGEEDYTNTEGTYGTRIASTIRLIELWKNSNVVIGIGMHPMWVVKPITEEENMYAWGFSDVRWAAVLAAYGVIGFLFGVLFQIYYFVASLKILKNNKKTEIITFFAVVTASNLFFDTAFNFSNVLFSLGLYGIGLSGALTIAALTYKYEEMKTGRDSL